MNEEEDMKNVVIYTRVSTEDQAEGGFSLDAQLEKLRYFCKAQDPEWNVVGEYIEEGATGTTTKRPQYQLMFKNIANWDAILVMKMDRIHRNRLNFIEMMNTLKKSDREFISVSENLNTHTAMGRFVMGIIQDIAELESGLIGERTFIAMKQKAKKITAGRNGGNPPYGFEWHTKVFKDHSGKPKTSSTLIPIPEKLKIVKESFELYLNGASIKTISTKFELNKNTVSYFLSNPIYASYHRWTGVLKRSENIKPIISETVFNLAQRRRCKFKNQHGDQKFNIKKNGIEYQPLILNGEETMEINVKKIKTIPSVHKAKHNIAF